MSKINAPACCQRIYSWTRNQEWCKNTRGCVKNNGDVPYVHSPFAMPWKIIPLRWKEATIGSPHSSKFQTCTPTGKLNIVPPSNWFFLLSFSVQPTWRKLTWYPRLGEKSPCRVGRVYIDIWAYNWSSAQQYLALDNGRKTAQWRLVKSQRKWDSFGLKKAVFCWRYSSKLAPFWSCLFKEAWITGMAR